MLGYLDDNIGYADERVTIDAPLQTTLRCAACAY
jgi:hypothetical protein